MLENASLTFVDPFLAETTVWPAILGYVCLTALTVLGSAYTVERWVRQCRNPDPLALDSYVSFEEVGSDQNPYY